MQVKWGEIRPCSPGVKSRKYGKFDTLMITLQRHFHAEEQNFRVVKIKPISKIPESKFVNFSVVDYRIQELLWDKLGNSPQSSRMGKLLTGKILEWTVEEKGCCCFFT